MGLLSVEHGKFAYHADFAFYAVAILTMAITLAVAGPPAQRMAIVVFAVMGLGSWSAIEYAFHRFVLHGLQPFRRLHAQHHARPMALICTPTIVSATLIFMLVFVPGYFVSGTWRAAALTLGVLIGYLAYSVTHHATHHWHARSAWLKERKRWHALHHHNVRPCCYGVTSSLWDHVFGTTLSSAPPMHAHVAKDRDEREL